MNIYQRALAAAFLLCAASASADVYQYQSVFFQGYSTGIFQPLNVNANKLVLNVSDGFPGQYSLDSLTLDFDNFEPMTVRGFRLLPDGGYVAKAYGAWVFKELDVVVRSLGGAGSFGQDVSVAMYVPNLQALLDGNMPPEAGFLLFSGSAPVFDVTPRRLADSETYDIDGKRLVINLMDRLGRSVPPSMPVPGFEQGFELNLDWLGHGAKQVFLMPPVTDSEFNRYRAVALNVDEIPGPEGIDHMLFVEYEQLDNGARLLSGPIALRDLLNQAYPQPL